MGRDSKDILSGLGHRLFDCLDIQIIHQPVQEVVVELRVAVLLRSFGPSLGGARSS